MIVINHVFTSVIHIVRVQLKSSGRRRKKKYSAKQSRGELLIDIFEFFIINKASYFYGTNRL